MLPSISAFVRCCSAELAVAPPHLNVFLRPAYARLQLFSDAHEQSVSEALVAHHYIEPPPPQVYAGLQFYSDAHNHSIIFAKRLEIEEAGVQFLFCIPRIVESRTILVHIPKTRVCQGRLNSRALRQLYQKE